MEKKDKAVYDMKYAKENLQQVRIALNKTKDADLLEWLSLNENKQGYIKKLIRKDIKMNMLTIEAMTTNGDMVMVGIDAEGERHLVVDGKEFTGTLDKLDPQDQRKADKVLDGLTDMPTYKDGKIVSGSGRIWAWQPAVGK